MSPVRQQAAGIEFTVAGPATDDVQTLICMHGIGGDDTSFAEQSAGLSDDYRVIAWNMPGYRGSDVAAPLSFEGLAAALLALLDALEIERAHLVGQSIGGMLAQEFYHRHRGRVATLVLIATTSAFGGRDSSFKQAFLKARLEPLDNGLTMQELARVAMPAVTGPAISAPALQTCIEAMAGLSESVYRDVLNCLISFDRRAEFSSIDCPVCLIAGSEDKNAPAKTMAKMAATLSQAEYHELANAGHLVNTELPDETNRIIRHFLRNT